MQDMTGRLLGFPLRRKKSKKKKRQAPVQLESDERKPSPSLDGIEGAAKQLLDAPAPASAEVKDFIPRNMLLSSATNDREDGKDTPPGGNSPILPLKSPLKSPSSKLDLSGTPAKPKKPLLTAFQKNKMSAQKTKKALEQASFLGGAQAVGQWDEDGASGGIKERAIWEKLGQKLVPAGHVKDEWDQELDKPRLKKTRENVNFYRNLQFKNKNPFDRAVKKSKHGTPVGRGKSKRGGRGSSRGRPRSTSF